MRIRFQMSRLDDDKEQLNYRFEFEVKDFDDAKDVIDMVKSHVYSKGKEAVLANMSGCRGFIGAEVDANGVVYEVAPGDAEAISGWRAMYDGGLAAPAGHGSAKKDEPNARPIDAVPQAKPSQKKGGKANAKQTRGKGQFVLSF